MFLLFNRDQVKKNNRNPISFPAEKDGTIKMLIPPAAGQKAQEGEEEWGKHMGHFISVRP